MTDLPERARAVADEWYGSHNRSLYPQRDALLNDLAQRILAFAEEVRRENDAHLGSTQWLVAHDAKVRREALEEAAKVADEWHVSVHHPDGCSHEMTMTELGEAIRSLAQRARSRNE